MQIQKLKRTRIIFIILSGIVLLLIVYQLYINQLTEQYTQAIQQKICEEYGNQYHILHVSFDHKQNLVFAEMTEDDSWLAELNTIELIYDPTQDTLMLPNGLAYTYHSDREEWVLIE